ncbi:DUF1801 domain-containing protein [Amphiplicatus metriothermophilus]|uniref:YdhG-like domain-containing protein n=1 Tax=Amphiplicatus metriothermophilus TaxID=1519374 RepID=A0A239PUL0_9PROT|nr:DUF1801 domain-containing protein [Amphiplicatus metriothermophilus]MBB5519435.1 hypothetical protein [Amphiplicatus metriothermophilus]SNT73616.1 hypothetical protein SAMN06297382_1905 [Amphiplicatus metriothermophilus]
MKKTPPAADPDAYVRALRGWRKETVAALRAAAKSAADLEETIKWGHIVYLRNGPALLIRAEEERVLFGFWRGKRLTKIDPALKPGGKYEMATRTFVKGDPVDAALAARLAREAASLNVQLGDPTKAARK